MLASKLALAAALATAPPPPRRLLDMAALASPLKPRPRRLTFRLPRVSGRVIAIVAALFLLLGAGIATASGLATPTGPLTRSLQPASTSPTPD
jgi:hypothetical protein